MAQFSLRRHGLRRGAEGAAARLDWYFAQALRTSLRRRVRRKLVALEARLQRVHGRYYKKVHSKRDQHKRNHGIQECAIENGAAVQGERERRKVGLAENRCDQRCKYVGDKRGHHGAKSGADDHGNGQVHNVATKEKLPKTREHCRIPLSINFDWMPRVHHKAARTVSGWMDSAKKQAHLFRMGLG